MLKKIKRAISEPTLLIGYLQRKDLFNWMTDKQYIKFSYLVAMNEKLDLSSPRTFNQKLQWLKLNNQSEEYSKVVDKYEVRDYIAAEIGQEYLIPLLGVWDKAEDIDYTTLPNEFVLKCTHNSGGVIVCRDKSGLDIEATNRKLNRLLKRRYYLYGREYPYKKVKPRIICEKYMDDGVGDLPNDYKILCFNGVPQNIMICSDRKNGHANYYFFDFEWNFLPYNKVDKDLPADFTFPKPNGLEEMYQLSEKLSKPYVVSRIDFYEINGKVYFGEITLFPASGLDRDITRETDELFGSRINLPSVNEPK
jgi:hypothetical protein